MMESILGVLNQTGGVLGAVIFSSEGECLGHQLSPPYEPILFSEMLPRIMAMSDLSISLESEHPAQSLVMMFDEGWLTVRSSQGLILMVLADKSANVSLLCVGIHTAFIKIRRQINQSQNDEMLSFGSISQKSAAIPLNGSPMPNRRNARVSNLSNSVNLSYTQNSIGMSTKGFKSGKAPKDAVGSEFVKHILKSFIRYAGGHAKPILQEEFRRMGISPRTLGQSQVGDLLINLSKHLNNQSDRDFFISTALGDNK